jgi:YVTN family beta-propeller protein
MRFFQRFPGVFVVLALAVPSMLMEQTAALAATPAQTGYLSPTALTATKDGRTLFIACATANRVFRFDTVSRRIGDSIRVPGSPLGLALSADDTRLFVTCAAPESKVCIVEAVRGKVMGSVSAGHTAMAPVLSQDSRTLYVCNRFNNDVSLIDLAARKAVCRIAVQREPVAADLTKDGRQLLVANHLHTGRADVEDVAAVVSVIDVATGKVENELRLPSGSGALNGLRVSPDGKYAAVTHIVASFNRAASQVRSGWMNANALTIIDLAGMEVHYTLLLDQPGSGAANPWGLAWSADSAALVVTHAGTHEVSVIDFPALLAGIRDAERDHPRQHEGSGNERADVKGRASGRTTRPVLAFISRYEGLAEGLPFLVGARQRVKLPKTDLGPRAVTISGHTAYVANYFSDTLSVIDLAAPQLKAESVPLGPAQEMSAVRKGEFYFHDATLCSQGWQSCSSCHPGDARADGLNWDLLNDGIGNPKNTKSLLLAFQTPPAMWLGVRETAETAVQAGIKHILFTEQPEEVAAAIDAYLKSLKPVPSPHLARGRLSEAARRGGKVFSRAGCAECHPPPLFTDLQQYDVGTRRAFDGPTDRFDTPTLVELWRTAPYLHDGSAATVRDVLTTRNRQDRHGKTAALSDREINDLCTYLLSL